MSAIRGRSGYRPGTRRIGSKASSPDVDIEGETTMKVAGEAFWVALPIVIMIWEIAVGIGLWGWVSASGRTDALKYAWYGQAGLCLFACFAGVTRWAMRVWDDGRLWSSVELWQVVAWYLSFILLIWTCFCASWMSNPELQWNAATSAGIVDTANPGKGSITVAWRLLFTAVSVTNSVGYAAYLPISTFAETGGVIGPIVWFVALTMIITQGLAIMQERNRTYHGIV